MEVVASLSQGRTAAAQCGLHAHKSVPVIFEPPCIICILYLYLLSVLESYLEVFCLFIEVHGPKNAGIFVMQVLRVSQWC